LEVYFGGTERPNTLHTLARAGGKRIILSYAEPPTYSCWKIIREYGFEVLLDSGAYSAWKRGRSISLDDYMDYIREHHITQYFNLDVVGNPEDTAVNQATMEAAGLSPIPVFHYNEPWELLELLIAKYALVGLGGTVGLPYRDKVYWLEQVYSRHPEGRFHALGITSERILTQFPFTQVDSTWWVFKNREKVKRLAPGKDRKEEQEARVRHLMALEKESGKGYQLALGF